jgi:adenosylcobinamide kinase/adenosylcobinamide-phosphate guanylyltransferase
METKIVFVTGGAKSGKSSFVLDKVSGVIGKKAFIATAEALDDEMKERINRHKAERGGEWETYEVPLKLSDALLDAAGRHSAVVLDCLTIWLSNVLIGEGNTKENIQDLVDNLIQLKESTVCSGGTGCSVLYIVSNEVGMGIVPENDLAREFRDLAGNLNQRVAEIADEVYLVVAGIPVKIK